MSRGKACWATIGGPLAAAGTSLSCEDPGGVTEKLREWLSGACPQSILQNKGGFPKRQMRW